jgi:hypothetical protein
LPKQDVVDASDLILVHGNGVQEPARITASVQQIRTMCATPKPIVFNEDDHYGFDQPQSNFLAALRQHASWGYFDYRRKGEPFTDGFQCVPVDWTIDSDRKRSFFNLLAKITGESLAK